MIDAGTDWAEAVHQIRAVRRALNRVALLLLAEQLEAAAASSHDGWNDETMERVLRETRDALLGGPATRDAQQGVAFAPGLEAGEAACPSA